MFHTVTPAPQAQNPQKDTDIPIPSHQPVCYSRYDKKQIYLYIPQISDLPHFYRTNRPDRVRAINIMDTPKPLEKVASTLLDWEEKFKGEFYVGGGTVRQMLRHLWFSWPFEKIDDLDVIATTSVSLEKLQEYIKSQGDECKEITGIFKEGSAKKLLQLAKINDGKIQPYATVNQDHIESLPLTYEKAQHNVINVLRILKNNFQTKDFFSGALALRFFRDATDKIRGMVFDPTAHGFIDIFSNRLRFIGIPQAEDPNEEKFSRFATRIFNDPILILRLIYLCAKERAFNEYEYYLSLIDQDTIFDNVPPERLRMWINKMNQITMQLNGSEYKPCFIELNRLGFLLPLLRMAYPERSTMKMIASFTLIAPTVAIAPTVEKTAETAEKEKKQAVSQAPVATPTSQPAARKP